MILDQLVNFHLYHCGVNNHNKVWGYFAHGAHFWAFWGGVGKAWSFKYHGVGSDWAHMHLMDLAHAKVRKQYEHIQPEQLDTWDVTWRERFSERFTYFLLQQPLT